MKFQNCQNVGRRFLALGVSILALLGLMALPARSQDLVLTIYPVQVMNTFENRVCQHVYTNGEFRLAWQSAPLEGPASVRIGDIDNDGVDEVVATTYYVSRTEYVSSGKGKKQSVVNYYGYRIHVFEPGESPYNGNARWTVDLPDELPRTLLRDTWIADVDNDGIPGAPDNEIVIMRYQWLHIGRVERTGDTTGSITLELLKCYAAGLDGLDVGDADNQPGNEIVVEAEQIPWVWKWTGTAWEEFEVDPVPLDQYGDASPLMLTFVRIRDVDNLGDNEIIATGTNERLMVWRWNGAKFGYVATSSDLKGNMAYGLDCGDLNHDNSDEVVINVWGLKKLPPRLVTLAYDSGLYVIQNTFTTDFYNQWDLRVADLTGDGRAEVIEYNQGNPAGLKIFRFVGASLQGGTFELVYSAPGYGTERIEIR